MGEAHLHRIASDRKGQLVDDGLRGERVELTAKRTQRRRADRHRQQPVDGHVDPGDVVVRLGVARRTVTAVGRWVDGRREHRDAGAMGVGQQAVPRRVAGPGRVAVAPQLVRPVGDRPVLVDAGRDVGDHGRTEWLPRHFVGAAPEHAHVPAGYPRREQCGVHGDVVGGIVAVAARTLDVLDDDRIGGQIQGRGNGAAQA